MKYKIEVWGCQMSEHDAENMAGMLEEMGYDPAETAEEADLVVLHTCCVREKAESKVLTRIGVLRKIKKERPDFILAVGGCMTQQEDVAKYIRGHFPDVDIIFGTHNLHHFPQLLAKVQEKKQGVLEIWDKADRQTVDLPAVHKSPLKAYVNIIYGCNNFCSYCIVPYVRGRERSRPMADIEAEVAGLLKEGYKEIMLLGQNVNSYGKNLEGRPTFADLLERLDGLGDYRLRYMTSHPRDFDPGLVETIRGLNNVCPQFHLPVQSGSDKVLKAMRRGYKRDHYKKLIDSIYQAFVRPVITTDIIVGFPGETEADFEDTLDLVSYANFDQSYMFLYSPRKETPAAGLDQVPQSVKTARFNRLMALQNELSLRKNQALKGAVLEVLVEGPSKNQPQILTGRTPGGKTVNFKGGPADIGQLRAVKITQVTTFSLTGQIVRKD